jgi:hypothetical protein
MKFAGRLDSIRHSYGYSKALPAAPKTLPLLQGFFYAS